MASPARCAAPRSSASSTRDARRTTAPAARPAGGCSPTGRCRGCCATTGRAPSRRWRSSGLPPAGAAPYTARPMADRSPFQESVARLGTLLGEAYDLDMVRSLLQWDQATYMPEGGAAARGRQLALIGRLHHVRATNTEIGRLLDALEPEAARLPHDSDDAALVRVTRRLYDRATRVPSVFVSELLEHFSNIYQAWVVARPANDFAT